MDRMDDDAGTETDTDQLQFMPILKPELPLLKPNPFIASGTNCNFPSESVCPPNVNSEHAVLKSGSTTSLDLDPNKESIDESNNSSTLAYSSDEAEPPLLKPDGLIDMKTTGKSSSTRKIIKPKRKKQINPVSLKRRNVSETDPEGDEQLNCGECPFVGKKPFSLIRHKRAHGRNVTDDVQYVKCNYCSYVTASKNLKRHSIIHPEYKKSKDIEPTPSTSTSIQKSECTKDSSLSLVKPFSLVLENMVGVLDPNLIKNLINPTPNIKKRIPDRDYPFKFWCMMCPYKSLTQEGYEAHKVRHLPEGSTGVNVCDMCFYNSLDETEHNAHYFNHYADSDDLSDDDDEDGTLAKELKEYLAGLAIKKLKDKEGDTAL